MGKLLIVRKTETCAETEIKVNALSALEYIKRTNHTILKAQGVCLSLNSLLTEKERIVIIRQIASTIPSSTRMLWTTTTTREDFLISMTMRTQIVGSLSSMPIIAELSADLEQIIHNTRIIGMLSIPVSPNIKSNGITTPVIFAKVKLNAEVCQQHHPVHTICTKGNTIANRKRIELMIISHLLLCENT